MNCMIPRITRNARPTFKDLDIRPEGMKPLSPEEALWWGGAFNVLFAKVPYVVTWAQEIDNFFPTVKVDITMNEPPTVHLYPASEDGSSPAYGVVSINDDDGVANCLEYQCHVQDATGYTLQSYSHVGHGFIVTTYTVMLPGKLTDEQERAWRDVRRQQGMDLSKRRDFPVVPVKKWEK